jgi:hypothetical protein
VNCYICESVARTRPVSLGGFSERPAVAVCQHCGAGVCFDHAVVLDQPAHRRSGLGSATNGSSTRRFDCPTCAAAESSVLRGAA